MNASCLTLFCSAIRKFKTQRSSTAQKVFTVVPGFDFALAGSQRCPGFDGGIRTCRNDLSLSVHYKVWKLEADEAKDANFVHFPLSCCVPAVFCRWARRARSSSSRCCEGSGLETDADPPESSNAEWLGDK